MDLDELSNLELKIHAQIISINEGEKIDNQLDFGHTYKTIYNNYLDFDNNLEALKRALFLTWYSVSEPQFLTGIEEFDFNSELKIIQSIDNLILKNETDYELDWMLSYYSTEDYAFEYFKSCKNFMLRVNNPNHSKLPSKVDRTAMKSRGIMGDYWNSLTIFK